MALKIGTLRALLRAAAIEAGDATPLKAVVARRIAALAPLLATGRSITASSGNGHSVNFAMGGSGRTSSEDEAMSFWGNVADLIDEYEPTYPDNNPGLLQALLDDDRLCSDGVAAVTEYRADFSYRCP